MGYLVYYLLWFVVSLVAADPRLLIGFVLLLVVSPFLPDPVRFFARLRHIRRLRQEISLNRANTVARRDLAMNLLASRRSRAALELVEEALARTPDDAELQFLRGKALLAVGRPDEALDALGRATESDASIGLGEPYVLAGDAHAAMGRHDEARDAYEHYLGGNHSDVDARRKLARELVALGARDEAADVRRDAARTFRELPGYLRRRQLRAYLLLQLDRLVA